MSANKLEEFEVWMLARRLSGRTIEDRLAILERFARDTSTPPEHADAALISRWFATNTHWSSGTVLNYHGALTAWFKWLILQGYRMDDPIIKVGKPRTPERHPRPITDTELARLLALRQWPRTRVMILLGAFAGLRVHEIARFSGAHIGADLTAFTVMGKGGTVRTLPLHPAIAAAARDMPAGLWFPSFISDTQPVRPKSVSAAIARQMKRCGINATPHALRHYYASSLLANGADIRVVQDLMRHRNIQNTIVYTRVPDCARRTALESLAVPTAIG